VIQSFRCDETREVFEGTRPRRLPGNLLAVMQRKLKMLDAAMKLGELRVPPGNRLEALKGGRKGLAQHPGQRSVAGPLSLGKGRPA
jgi:proteic killer suppression protein